MSPRSTCPAYTLENLVIMEDSSLGPILPQPLGPRSDATRRHARSRQEEAMARRIRMALLAASTALLTACGSPLYVWDTHTSSTPRARGLELAEVGRRPVAVLPVVAPGALQGFSASLSHAL